MVNDTGIARFYGVTCTVLQSLLLVRDGGHSYVWYIRIHKSLYTHSLHTDSRFLVPLYLEPWKADQLWS